MSIRKTAVIGASGYLGRHLWNAYRQAHPDVVGTAFSSTASPALRRFDIRSPDLDPCELEDTGHEAVIISSAKANIGYCEQNQADAHDVNVRGTLELMGRLGKSSLQVIFLSSDYVFDGSTGAYRDDAETAPTTEYGRHKASVEAELPRLTDNHIILRLSKIFGVQKGDATLLDETAGALMNGKEVRAAVDQTFCPTFVDDLVRAILLVQQQDLRGIINVCSPEALSRYEIARRVADAVGRHETLKAVKLYDIPGMSGRPLNLSMVPDRLLAETGATFTPLATCIEQVARAWRQQ